MRPEDRAKAVVAYFSTIPEKVRPQLEEVIARAIKRALMEQLAQLECLAASKARMADGRGKQAKGRDPWAIKFHGEWEKVFRELRRRV
jgi:hypothetical protein